MQISDETAGERLSDYDFALPEHLIATRPLKPRRAARLLVACADRTEDRLMVDLPQVLRPGDRLVLNDTRVIPARLRGIRQRSTRDGSGQAGVEVTLVQALPDGTWEVMARPLRKLAPGDVVAFGPGLEARVRERFAERAVLDFGCAPEALEAALAEAGEMPLPPYIAARRAPDARDREDYQTVFARSPGAVAAPTASLHFDQPLLEALAARGVAFSFVTLHVGAGTFLPVKSDDITAHRMHAEWGVIGADAAAAINATRAAGGRVIAAGTTALRLLETAAGPDGTMRPFSGLTDIFIRPGYRFRAIDGLMTNFHLPRSTLLMLVSALMGRQRIRDLYAHAIAREYRFFSYGDGSLLLPGSESGAEGSHRSDSPAGPAG